MDTIDLATAREVQSLKTRVKELERFNEALLCIVKEQRERINELERGRCHIVSLHRFITR